MTLEERLSALCPLRLEVRLHENRSTYLRVQKTKGVLRLSLHRLFADAPTPVLEAILRFASKKDRSALRVIRQMALLYFSENKIEPVPLTAQGRTYDLLPIYESLKQRYFHPEYDASIGWSDRKPRGECRFLTFGSYDRQAHQIRINQLLDDSEVPSFFVEFIVYHEMLHAVCLPIIDEQGRTWVHTREFKERERQFPNYAAVKAWEKQSLTFFRKRMKNGRA